MSKTIDINCDVGEGVANEALLMPYLSSCNIACTGHTGSVQSIDQTISLAIQNNVKIGAHPSFEDTENFGRKFIDMAPDDLQDSIEKQISLLVERAELKGTTVNHVKAHGALYNAAAVDEVIAKTLVRAIKNTAEHAILYVPYNSVIAEVAINNSITIKYEAFIDRNYNDDLTLVARNRSNAIITKSDKAFKHLYRMITEKKVNTVLNRNIGIKADTFCIHGDNENAIYILKYITKQLEDKGITVA